MLLVIISHFIDSRFYFLSTYPSLDMITENVMATHSSTLAWKIPWMEEHRRLQSMGWLRVRHG